MGATLCQSVTILVMSTRVRVRIGMRYICGIKCEYMYDNTQSFVLVCIYRVRKNKILLEPGSQSMISIIRAVGPC